MRWQPLISALLNAGSAICAIFGYTRIRRGEKDQHKRAMLTAAILSSLFLVNYLTYHAIHGHTTFEKTGVIRTAYFVVLISHTILAGILFPLVVASLIFGLTGRFERHRNFSRFTLPVWLYVSITGILIFTMLYT